MLDRISVVSPWFAGGLVGCAVLAWVCWPPLRRRMARMTALSVALVLSLATVATAVNEHFGYWPTVGDLVSAANHEHDLPGWPTIAGQPADAVLHRHPHGVGIRLDVPDLGSGFGPSGALVYLPPQYFADATRRFPVLYLFHGSPGVPGDWFRGGAAVAAASRQAAAGRPLIVVSPRMSHGWRDDPECVDGTAERVESHFVRDVLPTVDEQLRTIPDRTGRAVGGMSAGGYCALNLGLRHRDLISAIIDMSGDTRPTHAGGIGALFGTGPAAAASADANSPVDYAGGLPADPPTRIWLDCGTADTALLAGMRSIEALLSARGLAVELHVRPGGHTFYVWRPALADALVWLTQTSA